MTTTRKWPAVVMIWRGSENMITENNATEETNVTIVSVSVDVGHIVGDPL